MEMVKTGEHFCFGALGQESHSDILGLRCLSGVGSCILKLSGEVIFGDISKASGSETR